MIRGWSNLYLRFLFFLESFHVDRIGLTLVIFLIVKPRTRPILQKDLPKNKSVQVGESVTMKCLVVLSGTLPDFRWLKWDKSITFVSNIRDNLRDGAFQLIDPQYYSGIQRGESYESELKISNVTEEDFGLYTCYASNHIGAEYNSAFLSRYVRPTRALPSDRGKAIKGAMSDYLLSFLEANRFSHQLNFKKKNGPVLLFTTIFSHRNCFLSSVATDGKDGHGLIL